MFKPVNKYLKAWVIDELEFQYNINETTFVIYKYNAMIAMLMNNLKSKCPRCNIDEKLFTK